MRRARCLLLLLSASLLAACGGDADPGAAAAATAPAASASGANTDADSCPRWIGQVQALCTAFVEGRAVDADCPRHASMVLNSLPLMADQPEGVQASICARHLHTLDEQRRQGEARAEAVDLDPRCRELARVVKANCVDTLPTGADPIQCQSQLSALGAARRQVGEQQVLGCDINLQMLQR
jgi:hypothetical protein